MLDEYINPCFHLKKNSRMFPYFRLSNKYYVCKHKRTFAEIYEGINPLGKITVSFSRGKILFNIIRQYETTPLSDVSY